MSRSYSQSALLTVNSSSSLLTFFRHFRLAHRSRLVLIAFALVFSAGVARATDGQADPTFNAGGSGTDDQVNVIAVQSDGKILIAGPFRGYNGNASVTDFLLRLNADGSVDPTFNAGGSGLDSTLGAIAIQPDGKILIGGAFTSYNGDAAASDKVMRLNADGTRDQTFNAGGAGADGNVFALAIQPDGKILIAGFFTAYNGDASASDRIMRLNADGSRDAGFNPGGSGANFGEYAVALQPDGKILIGGFATAYNGDASVPDYIMRLNPDGTRDATFNPGGAGANNRIISAVVQPDGKIVIGGDFFFYNDDGTAPDNIMRLNADGTRDLSFNSGGTGTEGAVYSVALQNGKILIGSGNKTYNGDQTAPDHIMRLNADGTRDNNFNPGGVGASSVITAVAVQADGKILIGGLFTAYNGDSSTPDGVMRLTQDPPLPNFTLTVGSLNPPTGVNILVSPGDNAGFGAGVTQFTRTYSQNTTVFLTAPTAVNGNSFERWLLNGGSYSTNRTTSIAMNANATLTAVFTPAQSSVQFSSSNFNVQEDPTAVTITVNRTGDLSVPASVDYFTTDGTATQRRDYISAAGTLSFASGESAKSFVVLVNEDTYVEGNETVGLTLTNPAGATLGAPSTATLNIIDDSTEPATNPIDETPTFVEQQYHDFLNRQSDASGRQFWSDQIEQCGADAQCREVKRINVSGAFFLAIEFQQTGYLVERFYKVAYGDVIGTSHQGANRQLAVPIVRFDEFLRDTQRIGRGVVVLQPGWEQALEANKQAYALEFVQTSRFLTALPPTMTPTQFVDRLNQNAGNVLSASERTNAINLFGGASDIANMNARAQAVRQVAEDTDLFNAESNKAFVLAEYFGYLRRNPNDAPEASLDYTGYDFWLSKLNQFNGNYVAAEMVKAFISSDEYRKRFGN